MKTAPQDWLLWEQNETLPFEGGVSFLTRTTTTMIATNEFGLIVGFGKGEQEITVTGKGEISFQCDSPIWLRPASKIQERLQNSKEIFTTLDRPAPMSPEMAAIYRMQRKNEMQRERDRHEFEERLDAAVLKHKGTTEQSLANLPAAKAEKVGSDPTGSDTDASENEEPDTQPETAPDGVSDKTATGNGDT